MYVYVVCIFSITSVWGLPFVHDLFTLEHSSKAHSNWRVLESNPDIHIFGNADLWAPFLPFSKCYLIDIPLMSKAYIKTVAERAQVKDGASWNVLHVWEDPRKRMRRKGKTKLKGWLGLGRCSLTLWHTPSSHWSGRGLAISWTSATWHFGFFSWKCILSQWRKFFFQIDVEIQLKARA